MNSPPLRRTGRTRCGKLVAAILVFAPRIVTANPQAETEPIKTTICAIVHSPDAFDQKRVSVSGRIESDGIEHTVILDASCPNKGISITRCGEKACQSATWEELQDAIYFRPPPGTSRKKISATIIGTFHNDIRGSAGRWMVVDEVLDLVAQVPSNDR